MPNCAVTAISALNIPKMTITSATEVPASPPNPAYCDVRGSVDTEGNSAGFRIQLPATWNSKLLFYGVGGTGGSVLAPSANPVDMAQSLIKGYATAVTDTGHQGSNADVSFALLAPGVPNTPAIVDFAYRAAHEVTVAAKQLLRDFYAVGPVERSYFDGCSNGGRMALIAAMHYPDDYDGIIAGDPSTDQRQRLALLKGAKAFFDPPSARLPATMLPIIDADLYASCDAVDGVQDGLIQNPGLCAFDPQTLVCEGGNAANCLTQDQADGLENYLRPLTDEQGRVLVPGFSVTDLSGGPANVELYALGPNPPVDPTGPEPWGDGPAARGWALGDTYLKYWVYRDPTFNTQTFPMSVEGVVDDEALALYDERTQITSADDPAALSAFVDKGGKAIIYHGFSDHAISPFLVIRVYQTFADYYGGYKALQEHVRLFMVPGMQHCGSGPGPNSFDTLTALERWVEHGVAPDSIIATHYVNNNPSLGTDRTMPLCQFPKEAHYRGTGDVNEAANWTCPH
jgi:feruloyl esterase